MATKLPSGKWRTQVYIGTDKNGKRLYESFFGNSKKEADLLAMEYKVNKKRKAQNGKTLSEAIDNYIESFKTRGSPTTVDGYKKIKRCYCEGLLDTKLSKIDEAILQKHADTLAARVSPKTTREAIAFIKTVLKANGNRLGDIMLPRKKKPKYNTLPPEEMKKIFASVKDTDLELPVLLAAWLTLTRSECCGLKWSDIQNGILHVQRSMVYANQTTHIKDPKTETRERYIQIPPYIQTLIKKKERKSEFILDTTPDKLSHSFRRHLLRHKDLAYCSFHELRHFAASVSLILGIPDKYMQERGGWSSPIVMKGNYQQTFDEFQRIVTEKIDSFYKELFK